MKSFRNYKNLIRENVYYTFEDIEYLKHTLRGIRRLQLNDIKYIFEDV